MNDQARAFGEDKIFRLLFKFSLPMILGIIANATYNLVDRIFVGWAVGENAIAAITVVYPPQLILFAFGVLLAFGTNSLISINIGRKNIDKAEKYLGQAVLGFFIISIAYMAICLPFREEILRFFGATESIMPMCNVYFFWIIMGALPHEISFGINNFIRAEGRPIVAMITICMGAVLNIIFDPIFLFVFDMGIQGAAIATVLAQLISSAWVINFYYKKKGMLKLRACNLKIKWHSLKKVMAVGSPMSCTHLIACIVQAIFIRQARDIGGESAIAIIGIMFAMNMFVVFPVIGISQGAQPIIGYNFGAKHFRRVREGLLKTLLIAVIYSSIIMSFIQISARYIVMAFGLDSELINIGASSLKITLILFPLGSFVIVLSSFFQAIGKPLWAVVMTVFRQAIILIPLLLILPKYFGLNGIWATMPIGDIVVFCLALFLFFKQLKWLEERIVYPK